MLDDINSSLESPPFMSPPALFAMLAVTLRFVLVTSLKAHLAQAEFEALLIDWKAL